ncbi:sialate O-acetylesterase [Actomonas aquatica]|uniref:Sialate O-acetylesterase n=1 Tax=Actomonas aquatica TaxID=2866162 RepID=A0ABZ1CF79_9BACT|nr:sialate O-acetylesterase [Opitutus sp. WL0086]WRQ89947.1 sialate O-acetylesterase [Opitutus sp. WL0086]
MLRRLLTLTLLSGFAFSLAHAELKLAAPFGDHMVLQRGHPIPVWGWADPGAEVTVDFAAQSVSTTVDPTGAWHLTLPPLGTSATPRDFQVTANQKSKIENQKFTDVLVGEVWLVGGQSNMERQLGPRPGQKPIIGWEAEVAAADRPLFRQLYVTQTRALTAQASVEASWSVCTPDTADDFTAVGYFFGRDLRAALGANVPVGIIHSSWGGTPAEAWTSEAGLAAFPEFTDAISTLKSTGEDEAEALQRYLDSLDAWFAQYDPGTTAGADWTAPTLDASDWDTMTLPVAWENAGHDGYDGLGWFTRRFELPAAWQGQDLTLRLGRIDDIDTTWFNGQLLGTTTGWQTERVYTVPASALHAGTNVITVRVLDTGGGGGIWDADSPLDLAPADATPLNLAGDWHYRLAANLKETPYPPQDLRNSSGAPTGLYNGMIAPLVPYALRGFAFYQGESNADRPTQYRTLLPALIADWRAQWQDDTLPFLFVQIAPHESQPPEIREAQLLAWQETEYTSMVVTLDVGDATDIHPAQKEPVGQRLALAARALAYDEDLTYSGPVFESVSFDGDTAILHFTHVADGLVAPGGTLRGFTLAGADGEHHAATATIKGDTVRVSSLDVPAPTTVHYAWAHVANGNLFNTAGLPASPFRTDHP